MLKSLYQFLKYDRGLIIMINHYLENGVIKSDIVESAMKQVDRADYVSNNPYMDTPQSIGYGVTISAPHMVRTCSI